MNGNCYFSEGINPTLTCNKNEGNRVAIPVLTPGRSTKRQNGRRFKEDGEEAFTLTSQDRHGVAIGIDDLYANRDPRFYDEEISTLRSDRNGLKVAVDVAARFRDNGMQLEANNENCSNALSQNINHSLVGVQPVQMSGNKLSDSEDVAHSLNCTDQRKVFGSHQKRTMVGYNATSNEGGA